MPPSPSTGGPSSTTWRRERLMRIGSNTTIHTVPERGLPTPPSDAVEQSPTEHTSLHHTTDNSASYGTIPARRRPFKKNSLNNFATHRGLSQLPSLSFLRRTTSNPATPRSPSILRELAFSRLSTQRPISAYDAPLRSKDDVEPDADAKINGIRVWYSSFSSIDWLHDAIKDSARFSRLRRRKSVRARVRLAIDKSLGWFVVTIVGFLTAVVAFLIVRGEQWLFDTKDGYCRDAWWRAKRFCCPEAEGVVKFSGLLAAHVSEDDCAAWRPWADVFSQNKGGTREHVVEYLSYALIAVRISPCYTRFKIKPAFRYFLPCHPRSLPYI
jgi:chloride channel 3/4/5